MVTNRDFPILSTVDDDLDGAVAIDDGGQVDEEETQRLHYLLALTAAGHDR